MCYNQSNFIHKNGGQTMLKRILCWALAMMLMMGGCVAMGENV